MGQREALGGVVADQALALCGRQGGAERDDDVGDRRVAEALALLVGIGEPVHEPGEPVGRHVDQLEPAGEVAARVVGDQPSVLVACVLPEAASTLSAVALDPLVEVAQERDRRPLLQLAAVAIGLALALDPARLVIRAGVALSLLARDAEDDHVADHLAVAADPFEDAGRLGLAEPSTVAAAWTLLGCRRTIHRAHELSPRGPGAGRCSGAAPFDLDGLNG